MAQVPLPDTPCLRVRLSGTDDSGNTWGTRFFLSYAGGAPSGADCIAIADDISTAYANHLVPLTAVSVALTEIDVLDIATRSGLSGQWNGNAPGSASGGDVPIQVSQNVEYGIARRYRGGKPRGFWVTGTDTDILNQSHWTAAWVTTVQAAMVAFFAEVEAISQGAVGALRHVNLSFYQHSTVFIKSGGRAQNLSVYRPIALHDNITGYFAKQLMGSQRRRRTSTTP